MKEEYSFSKLSCFDNCALEYAQKYIEGKKDEGNIFAEYGKTLHSILERYAKGELQLLRLPEVYEWEMPLVTDKPFPKLGKVDLAATYYKQGLAFFKEFEGYDDCGVIGTEAEFRVDIDDWTLHGVVDIIFLDQDGRLIIRDYKSKGEFKSKREKEEYFRQLYLYSAYIKEAYGLYPDELQFLLCRKNTVVKEQFDFAKFNEALDWAREIIAKIRNSFAFPPTYDDMYCKNLCGFRSECTFAHEEGETRKLERDIKRRDKFLGD